jgi:UPF0716 protein FxsA
VAKYLFLAFVVVPFLELYLLIAIGRQIGPAPTLGFVLATALLGGFFAKREGGRVLRRWQTEMAERRVPEEGLLSGVLVLAGGVLLVIPGVITDVLGVFLLIPPARRWVMARLRRALERRMKDGTVRVTVSGGVGFRGAPPSQDPVVRPSAPERRLPGEVDAEFTEEGPGR